LITSTNRLNRGSFLRFLPLSLLRLHSSLSLSLIFLGFLTSPYNLRLLYPNISLSLSLSLWSLDHCKNGGFGILNRQSSDDFEDACSICLEPFNSQDPPTVTNCRHEYHLQCILEWSQRSKECPICWQLLVLKDPSSQELLAAVENERNLRSRRNARHIREDYEMNIANSYGDDSDFNERIMRHFAAAARRARYVERRERPRSSGIGPPLVLLSVPTGDLPLPDVQHLRTTSPEERQTSSYEFSEGDSPTFSTLRSVVPEVVNVEPNSVGNRDRCNKPRVLCSSESPQRPSSSEFLAFLESVKLKFSAASARYKESISKSTRGFKEKLLAHNISVRELAR
ncbi:E3 ubiquitin-protein ligase RHF1A-like, partial [Camellia sinensis]|uniref:E3 ubiquitin-protein ligase RHF1A-like n=1 Tax=Camellia sinensis TaxID=4442 RepID=UPI001036CEC9